MYGIGLLALVAFSLAYWTIYSIFDNRRHAKRAAELGCRPPARRQHRFPLGIDLVLQLVKADKEKVLPNHMLAMQKEVGKSSWTQNVMGTDIIVTNEPENIKAVLATKFNDFEIGSQRRGNFFPMFGNGIFTADGKLWYVSIRSSRSHSDMDQGAFAGDAAAPIRPGSSR